MSLDPPIEAVYSSPYYRCLQTIAPFIELKQQEVRSVPDGQDDAATTIRPEFGLCEFFGAAPFDHPTPASHKRLKTTFPAYDDTYVSAIAPSRKGETIQDLYQRVEVAVQAIIDRCDAEGTRAAVLCTHAAVVIALGRVLTGTVPGSVDTEDFQAFTCGLSVFRRRGTVAGTGVGLGISTQGGAGRFVVVGRSTLDLALLHPRDLQLTNTFTTDESAPPQPALAWQCELDSDCSFLSSGAERGWYVAPKSLHDSFTS